MLANVTEQLWIDFDLDSAVFLDTLAFWLKKNASNKQPRNFYEGRYWTYNTLDAFHIIFPGWSKDTIRGIIRKCVKNDLLIVSNFNKKKYDRTCWYTLTDKALKYYPSLGIIMKQIADNPGGDSCGDLTTPCGEIPTPIPKELTTLRDNTNSESGDSPKKVIKGKKPIIELRKLIEIYAHHFPNNPQPHPRVIATSLEKTLRTLIKRWPEADPNKSEMTYDSFDRYMSLLKTNAPGFTRNQYVTPSGNKKMNNLEIFTRWNTFVKFLEGSYS